MTLRWRLTLFYTSLLALLLLIIGVAVVGVLQSNLLLKARNELWSGFISANNRGRLPSLSNGTTTPLGINPYLFVQFDEIVNVTPDRLQTMSIDSLPYQINYGQAFSVNLLIQNADGTYARPSPYFVVSRAELAQLQRETVIRGVRKKLRLPDSDHEINVLVLMGIVPYTETAPALGASIPSSGIISIAYDLTNDEAILRSLQSIVLLVSLIGLVLAGVGAYLLAGRALQPLAFVRDAAESISEKTLRRRVPEPDTGDEVQDLARALNRMLQRLEGSFEAQRRFTSDASHELRTPVTAISGHAGYLLRRTSPNPQQAESLNIIKNEADRLSNLIASLLELARSDSGANPLRRQRILARFFLDDIAREVRPLAQAQGATVKVKGEEVEFSGDPDKLRQVVLNLVSNALKAGAHEVTLVASREENDVLLRVADDGPGIAPEHLGKLFDRFYRVEESRSRDVGGSGLGLAIVKAIVDAHEGLIWVQSEVGCGTTVFVKLPVGEIEPEEVEAEEVA